jgi:hypothetical protein
VKLPHECSKQDLVAAILKAMDLPSDGTLREMRDLMLEQLKEREISLLHLDELQHTVRSNTPKVFEAIQDLVKQLLDRDDWHLHMILSGMPRIHKMRQDRQIGRRTHNFPFHAMVFEADDDLIKDLLKEVANEGCGLAFADELNEPEFRERLCLSVGGAWGTMIEMIQTASFRALARNRTELTLTDFAREFERASGFPDDENIFLAPNFRDLTGLDGLAFMLED